MKLKSEETIAAIATPAGVGGIGVVRLSGARAVEIVAPLFRPAAGGSFSRCESHRLVYGWVVRDGEPVDEAMAVVMRAPRSYTREDVVEVQCHGGALVMRSILDLFCQAGARLAEPGEFTRRAFLNGRLDLTQVEAVAEIVGARSREGLRLSVNQLRGRLHGDIQQLQGALRRVAALLAAGIDFPEEDIVFAHREEIVALLQTALEQVSALLETADQGRILRDGLAVAIVGKPNVGKSSLLNALLRENRAIVTDIPGTTRDTVEESAQVGGLVLNLVDTAGMRATEDRVEREGINRSRAAMEKADLVLLMVDGTAPLGQEDRELLGRCPLRATLVVVNKGDLMPTPGPPWSGELLGHPAVVVSALTGAGMNALGEAIRTWALGEEGPHWEHGMITNLRQKHAAGRSREALQVALAAARQGVGEELVAVDVQRALDALGEIVGETAADDLLDQIFSEFCIGK